MKSNPPSYDFFTAISGLAHELDSPLKSILMRTKKLIGDYKNRDFEFISYKDFKVIISTLEQIERQLEYCSSTTNRMLYMGKCQARLEESNCQVNDVIKHVVTQLDPQIKSARIKLISRLSPQLPLSALGPVECHQVIHNLIVNAIQAMPGGGMIKLKSLLSKTRQFINIEIMDEGIGMSSEQLTKVFEPFFTTKERGIEKSAGLGLSIVYSIINAVGGTVHIKSSLRQGTTVQISLPVYKSK